MNRDQSSKAACNDDTVQKLRDLHPEISLDLNLDSLPTPEALAAFCDNGSVSRTFENIFARVEGEGKGRV